MLRNYAQCREGLKVELSKKDAKLNIQHGDLSFKTKIFNSRDLHSTFEQTKLHPLSFSLLSIPAALAAKVRFWSFCAWSCSFFAQNREISDREATDSARRHRCYSGSSPSPWAVVRPVCLGCSEGPGPHRSLGAGLIGDQTESVKCDDAGSATA